MSNRLALREIEKKAWLCTFEHGLWDIGIGSITDPRWRSHFAAGSPSTGEVPSALSQTRDRDPGALR